MSQDRQELIDKGKQLFKSKLSDESQVWKESSLKYQTKYQESILVNQELKILLESCLNAKQGLIKDLASANELLFQKDSKNGHVRQVLSRETQTIKMCESDNSQTDNQELEISSKFTQTAQSSESPPESNDNVKSQLAHIRDAYERAQSQMQLLGNSNAQLKVDLENEKKISALLEAEVNTLPDYIQKYHSERKTLLEKLMLEREKVAKLNRKVQEMSNSGGCGSVQVYDELKPGSPTGSHLSNGNVSPLSNMNESSLSKENESPLSKENASPIAKETLSPLSNGIVFPLAKESPLSDRNVSPLSNGNASPLAKESASPLSNGNANEFPIAKETVSPLSKENASPLAKESPLSNGKASPLAKESVPPLSNGNANESPIAKETVPPLSKGNISPLAKENESPFSKENASPLAKESASPHSKEISPPLEIYPEITSAENDDSQKKAISTKDQISPSIQSPKEVYDKIPVTLSVEADSATSTIDAPKTKTNNASRDHTDHLKVDTDFKSLARANQSDIVSSASENIPLGMIHDHSICYNCQYYKDINL